MCLIIWGCWNFDCNNFINKFLTALIGSFYRKRPEFLCRPEHAEYEMEGGDEVSRLHLRSYTFAASVFFASKIYPGSETHLLYLEAVLIGLSYSRNPLRTYPILFTFQKPKHVLQRNFPEVLETSNRELGILLIQSPECLSSTDPQSLSMLSRNWSLTSTSKDTEHYCF